LLNIILSLHNVFNWVHSSQMRFCGILWFVAFTRLMTFSRLRTFLRQPYLANSSFWLFIYLNLKVFFQKAVSI
jgi:hypothetical protein